MESKIEKVRCKHRWMWLYPDISTNVDLFIELLGDDVSKRSVVCNICGISGHKINSRRGGIRVHTSNYFLNKANELAKKYGFKIAQKPIYISKKSQ